MIQVTRLFVKQLCNLLKRSLGLRKHSGLAVKFTSGPRGLTVSASNGTSAVQYRDEAVGQDVELLVPIQALRDVEGAKTDSVHLELSRPGTLAVRWQDQGVSKVREYPVPKAPERVSTLPPVPERWVDNPPSLVTALRDAFETTDPKSSRYALACVQLKPDGTMNATDGRHALVQTGFSWDLEQDLLIRGTTLFQAKELQSVAVCKVGTTDNHFVVRAGPWTFWLSLDKDGCFPKIQDSVPSSRTATTTVELTKGDSAYLVENVRHLPGGADHRSVTLDLNGSVILRSKTDDTPAPMELVLSNSFKTGEDVRFCTDRRYLLRAAELGFTKLYLHGAETAALCADETRSYIWMPHDVSGVVLGQPGCSRIESALQRASRISRLPPTTHQTTTMPKTETASLPQQTTAAIKRRPRVQTDKTKLPDSIEQALALKEQLRGSLTAVKELIRRLKADRKQQRLLKNTLASLKQLQQVA